MGVASLIYNTVAKRTSTFVLAMGVSAFVFERGKKIILSHCFKAWSFEWAIFSLYKDYLKNIYLLILKIQKKG